MLELHATAGMEIEIVLCLCACTLAHIYLPMTFTSKVFKEQQEVTAEAKHKHDEESHLKSPDGNQVEVTTDQEEQSLSGEIADAFFNAAVEEGGRPLNSSRICLVGQGRAGKTA